MALIQELEGMIYYAQEQINGFRSTITACDEQIKRLEPVYRKLSELKEDFEKARKNTKKVFEEKGSWKGDTHTSFLNAGKDLDYACKDYYRQLDSAMDTINDKIAELDKKKVETLPIIRGLYGQIEQWRTDIQNALN